MIDGAGGGETLPRHPANIVRHLLLGEKAYGAGRELAATLAPLEEAATFSPHPASKARHLLLGEKAWGAALVERRRNGIAIVRDVRQHGIRRAKLGIFSSGRRLRAGIKSTQRKNVHGRVASMHVSGQMGFPAGRAGAYAAGAGHSQGRTQPKLDAAEAGRSRSRTQPGLTQAGGHAPNRVPRRVSCAGRGPGSGCAAAHARGPGAGCRRHSPGRGSAAGCAGRRLHRP